MTPKISIISPSFNCASLIRRCIESVMAQNYPNFEHIIVDGASTDGTVEILKEYPHLRWISEPDKGEAEALNKALSMVTGDVVNWLNVDDSYLGTTVYQTVIKAFASNPDCGMVYGRGLAVNDKAEILWCRRPFTDLTVQNLMRWFANPNLFQPAMFYRRAVVDDVGFFREDLHYGIDYDYWLRVAARGHKSLFLEQVLALATLVREGAKSQGSYEDQHLAWAEIAKPFQQYLTPGEKINYWKDFYFFRIRPPCEYKHELLLPTGEAELQGFAIAAFELGHIPFAIQAINILSAQYPNSPETYWLLSEALNRTGDNAIAVQAQQKGVALALEQERA